MNIPCRTKLRISSKFLFAQSKVCRGRSVPGVVATCPPNTLDKPTLSYDKVKEFSSGKTCGPLFYQAIVLRGQAENILPLFSDGLFRAKDERHLIGPSLFLRAFSLLNERLHQMGMMDGWMAYLIAILADDMSAAPNRWHVSTQKALVGGSISPNGVFLNIPHSIHQFPIFFKFSFHYQTRLRSLYF